MLKFKGKEYVRQAIDRLMKAANDHDEEAIVARELVEMYLPRMLKRPGSATRAEIDRYNTIIRSNVFIEENRKNFTIYSY